MIMDRNNEPQSIYWEHHEAISISKSHLDLIFSKKINSHINQDDKHEAFLAWKKDADIGIADAQYFIGRCYEEGDGIKRSYKQAFHYYKLAADQGNSDSQFHLATLFEDGLGVKQSETQALNYYQLAANQGDRRAWVKLGHFYAKGKGNIKKCPKTAIEYYQKAANAGLPSAYTALAKAYERGIGVKQSLEQAHEYYDKAFQLYKERADAGDPEFQAVIGEIFELGQGVEKSLESAFYYYKLSADQMCPTGLYELAECFANGKGVHKSLEHAMNYYRLAIETGDLTAILNFAKFLLKNQIDEDKAVEHLKYISLHGLEGYSYLIAISQYYLGECFEKGIGIKQSNQNAAHYYELAAKAGNRSSLNRLGNAYLNGELGLKRSIEKAIHYYSLAANNGCCISLEKLAECYEVGIGVEKSINKAIDYYTQAALQGSSYALLKLGECYEQGRGVEKNIEKALQYYQKAADLGDAEAFFHLGRFYQIGQYVEQSVEKALEYYKIALKNGYRQAKSRIKVCEELLEQQKQNSNDFIIDPQAKKLDADNYLKKHNLKMLKALFDKSQNAPIYLEAYDLAPEELKVICDALISNHRFVLICSKKDMKTLLKIFHEAGHQLNKLWRERLKKQDTEEIVYGLRFREEMVA
jgi:TPR repeat protein